MQTFREASQWIRDYVNEPRHQQHLLSILFSWNQLCTAMDVIDDIDLALEAYLAADFPDVMGEKYLRIYGVLQALFVQQDALGHLINVIRPSVQIDLSDVLKEVRDLRSASIGHPTEFKRKGAKSVHAISRITLGKNGFEMLSFDEKNGTSFKHVHIRALIEKQRIEATRILSEIIMQLKEEDNIHREKFRNIKLQEPFNQAGYAFEKISEELRGNRRPMMGTWGIEHLQDCLDQFTSLLRARGMNLDTYDSIRYRFDEMKYPLGELMKFFHLQESDIRNRQAAGVFADALQEHFFRLKEIAVEIDQEYEQRLS